MTSIEEEQASAAIDRLSEQIASMDSLWRRSLAEMAPGASVDLYVVDTDVVMMFMSPVERHNYGALLRYDRAARRMPDDSLTDLETQTVEFLGNLLFFQLKPTVPLALLPDHAAELEHQLNAIGGEAFQTLLEWDRVTEALRQENQKVYATSYSSLRHAEQAVADEQAPPQERETRVRELLKPIFDSLRGAGPIGKLFRFDTLINDNRLRHLDRLELFDEDGRPAVLPAAPRNAQGGYARSGLAVLERRLEKKMMELYTGRQQRGSPDGGKPAMDLQHHRRRQRTIPTDARALAHLAWLNEQLRESSYFVQLGRERRRVGQLLLISGSQLMPRTVNDLGLASLQRVIFSPLSFLGHQMIDEYMRAAVTLDAGLDDPQDAETSLLIHFLDSMQQSLSRAAATGDQEDIIRTLRESRRDHVSLIESWKGKQLLSPGGTSDTVTKAKRQLEDAGESFQELSVYLGDLSVKAWQRFARSIAFINYRNADARGVQRNIPPVSFAAYPEAEAQSLALRESAFRPDPSGEGPLKIRELQEEDPSHYTEFMCYGLWNLGHRMLSPALGCVEQALSIAEQSGDGRLGEQCEALFLRAHLLKLSAGSTADLERGGRCMRQIDALRPPAAGEAPDLRYAAEAFSILCHRLYMLNLRDRKILDGPELLAAFQEGMALRARLHEEDGTRPRDYVSEYVRQQVLGNLVHLALLCRFEHLCLDDGSFQVYLRIEPREELATMEQDIDALVGELIEVCEFLDREAAGASLPQASLVTVSLAAVAAEVWLGKKDLEHWFSSSEAQWTTMDQQRVRYLDGVLHRQRR